MFKNNINERLIRKLISSNIIYQVILLSSINDKTKLSDYISVNIYSFKDIIQK